MKILLDTHVALWWINEHEKLSPEAKSILRNDENQLYFSIVSLWEIAIKTSLGKLADLSGGISAFTAQVAAMPVYLLPIKPRHVEIVEALPFVHRDPFDRMLVAAAKAEGMTILTADTNIHGYDVRTMW